MLKKTNRRISNGGFTLIEILIVVAIIGILASIALVGLGGTRSKARDAKRIAEVRQIQSALELYFNRCGWYPGPADCGATPPLLTTADDLAEWQGMAAILNDPDIGVTNVPDTDPSGGFYFYGSPAGGLSYVLGATLEGDNQSLREDVDGDINGVSCGAADNTDRAYCVQF